MSDRIIDLHQWFQTPAGRYLLDWERIQIDAAVADIFGYHALQIGVPELHGLGANRMPHRWFADDHAVDFVQLQNRYSAAFMTDSAALPFPASSLDLVVLPHTLELGSNPHASLREVERVLVPEGRVVICGFNPLSLWGLRQQRAHLLRRFGGGRLFLPDCGEFIGQRRLRDWLRLLSLEVEQSRFGCYRPALDGQKWLDRCEWMDRAGARWWPIFGSAYFLVAVKRVKGMRLLGAQWKRAATAASATVPVANRVTDMKRQEY